MSARWSIAALVAFAVAAGCSSSAPPACHYNADCPSQEQCVSGACVKASSSCPAPSHACSADADCSSKQCQNGCCAIVCASRLDCPSGYDCVGGTCQNGNPSAGCQSDADCAATTATPRCLASTGACVACLGPGDCPAGQTCTGHSCVGANGCQSDQSCSGATPHCDTGTGQCVQCVDNSQCDGRHVSMVCVNNVCIATGCHSDQDCSGATPHCDTGTLQCVQCVDNSQCSGSQTCVNDACVATGCHSDQGCPGATPHCDTGSGQCVQCVDSSQCSGSQACVNDACVTTGCQSDQGCSGATPHCDTGSGRCVQCVDSSQCSGSQACVNDACVATGCQSDQDCSGAAPHCDTGSGRCVQCVDSAQCSGSQACVNDACVASGCASDADCASTPGRHRCDAAAHACVACLSGSDCPSGYTCSSESCVALSGLDGACSAGNTCPSGLMCIQQGTTLACRAPCDLYADPPTCATGRYCAFVGYDGSGRPAGACLPGSGGALGTPCSAQSPCLPNLACIPNTATTGTCRAYCDLSNPTASCQSPNVCQPLVRLDQNDVPRTYGVCFPATSWLKACGSDAGCTSGMVCAVSSSGSSPTSLTNECVWPQGSGGVASPCGADTDCASGICLPGAPKGYGSAPDATAGFCQGGCLSDGDCPSENGLPGACGEYGFYWYDATGSQVTENLPTCVVECSGASDCRSGDTCELYWNLHGDAWAPVCAPQTGSLPGGAQCTSDGACASDVCMKFGNNSTDGFCLGVCDPSQGETGNPDCDPAAVCPANGVMQTLPGLDGTFETNGDDIDAPAPICWGKRCSRDADCAGLSADTTEPRACDAWPDPTSPADIVLDCLPRQGSVLGGGVCATDADCASDWCVAWLSSSSSCTTDSECPGSTCDTGSGECVLTHRCFGACQSSTDCTSTASDKTTCELLAIPSGATRQTMTCVPQ